MMLRSAIVFVTVAVALVAGARKTRVTCVGDSITEGGGCDNASYTEILQDILGSKYEVTNAGKSSQTMLKKGLCNDLTPCSYWDTSAWQTALDSQPDIVTIMLGTNDAKYFNWEGIQQDTGDYYALDFVDMIRTVRKLPGSPQVYVVVPPPLYEPYPFDMNATVINQIYPALLRDIKDVVNAQLVDVFSAFRNQTASDDELTCAGCHPTEMGPQNNAQTIADAITGK
jgi:acyl-CoA thioesterase-1